METVKIRGVEYPRDEVEAALDANCIVDTSGTRLAIKYDCGRHLLVDGSLCGTPIMYSVLPVDTARKINDRLTALLQQVKP